VLPNQSCRTPWGGDRWVWINDGMMIRRTNLKKLGEKSAPVPLHPPQISH
jgi:hypothetical protein